MSAELFATARQSFDVMPLRREVDDTPERFGVALDGERPEIFLLDARSERTLLSARVTMESIFRAQMNWLKEGLQ